MCPAPTGLPAGVLDPLSAGERQPNLAMYNRPAGAVVDATGRVLVFGGARCRAGAADYDGAIWRFTVDGAPDVDFGVGGTACVGRLPGGAQEDYFYDLGFASDGRIVAVGRSGNGGMVVRLNEGGAPDATFGEDGARGIAVPISPWEQPVMSINAVLVERGRIVVTGANADAFTPNTLGFVVALTEAGALDPTFNRGRVLFDTNTVGYHALVRDADSYLVAGIDRGTRRGRIARLNLDGSPATDFGAGGVAVLTRPDAFFVQGMVVGDDGAIVVAGAIDPEGGFRQGVPQAAMVRLDAHGVVDERFMPGNPPLPVRWNLGYQYRSTFARQCDGRLLLTGLAPGDGRVPSVGVGLVRFTADGVLDPTFGQDGVAVRTNPGPAGRAINAVGVAIDPAGDHLTLVTNENTGRTIGIWKYSQ